MAQWIPKTAWKAQNLSKIYGVGEIGLFTGDQVLPPKIAKPGNFQKAPFLATPFRPVPSVVPQHQQKDNSQFKEAKAALKKAYMNKVPFIDLRDQYEMETKPLKNALPLHHHDLLSGAANEVLPQDRKNAQIVVFASSQQRVVNGFKALRRWGFESVVVTNYDVVADFDA